jgi:hypothetical protein
MYDVYFFDLFNKDLILTLLSTKEYLKESGVKTHGK